VQGLEALADRYDLIFCDVWGVLHDGIAAFPPAAEALQRYRAGGRRAVVLVSNAPRPGSVVADQLDSLGVPRSAYNTIVTSGDLTRAIVAERGTEMVHHLGPERDMRLFDGLEVRFGPIGAADYVVCTGLFDDERETLADYEKTLRDMLGRDLWMVCANPDIVVERGDRLILCAGALAAAYEEMGGRSYTGGKPHRPIYEAALAAGAEALGSLPEPTRMLGIGDAIRTDVAGARGFGIDALLVARGIHAAELGYVAGQLERKLAFSWLGQQAFQPTAITSELTWT
jgi:HAD superfamily hydrolase (TIGR01459 family)